ncbi:MAG: hypothetical protein RL268_92 [Pseudomonadota bacterium]|jgi:hypothetical protein
MNPAVDRPRFAVLITDAMAFYGKDVSPFALNVWWQACERFDFEQVSRALTRHALDPERGQFAPKPADLVRMLAGTATDRAQIAWGKACEAMQRVGAYQDVVFDDPVIHAVIDDLGGWPKFCRGELSELSYLQHRFTESYRAYAGREGIEYPRKLIGDRASDEMYSRRGLPPPGPAIVGHLLKAREVYRTGNLTGKTAVSFQALQAIEAGRIVIGGATQEAA